LVTTRGDTVPPDPLANTQFANLDITPPLDAQVINELFVFPAKEQKLARINPVALTLIRVEKMD
jgi:hypothetical protein